MNEYYDPFTRPKSGSRTYAMGDHASEEEFGKAGRAATDKAGDSDDFWEFDENYADGEDGWGEDAPDAGGGWDEEDDSWIDLAVPELKKPPRGRAL